jgi:cobalamin biosynthesis protein CobD/CbiB
MFWFYPVCTFFSLLYPPWAYPPAFLLRLPCFPLHLCLLCFIAFGLLASHASVAKKQKHGDASAVKNRLAEITRRDVNRFPTLV